jgi:hypothetical protein
MKAKNRGLIMFDPKRPAAKAARPEFPESPALVHSEIPRRPYILGIFRQTGLITRRRVVRIRSHVS